MPARFAAIASLALALALAGTAPALAAPNYYFAQGTSDSPLATCQAMTGYPSYHQCDSVRAAVNAANANPTAGDGGDVVFLQAAGDYTLDQELTLTDDVTIFGRGPRTTTLRGGGSARVLTVAPGVTTHLYRFTVAGGRAGTAEGGNILNHGQLFLYRMRVTDGVAGSGGGIANVGPGTLGLLNVLVDRNIATVTAGGGIVSRAGSGPADLDLYNTTVALNRVVGEAATGGGVATLGSAGNQTSLTGVTIARNSALGGGPTAGIYVGTQGETVDTDGSLIASNTVPSGGRANCGGPGGLVENSSSPSNREDASTCGFEISGGEAGLSADLVNAGGDTDVLTISSDGIAKNAVSTCIIPFDQRDAPRETGGTCDAGAFEEGAVAPPIDSGGFIEPTPVQPPPPPPVPTATPEPTPVFQQTVVAKPIKGTVRVRRPGSRAFIELEAGAAIPLGSTLDTKKGTVEIAAVPKVGAAPDKAEFHDGIFRVTQSRGITDLKLTEQLAPCSKRARTSAKKPKSRKLWGDGKGSFRTTGKYSAATVRGTEWLVQDTCSGTLTRVRQGVVRVRDNVKRKTITLRAPKRYTARPRR